MKRKKNWKNELSQYFLIILFIKLYELIYMRKKYEKNSKNLCNLIINNWIK
jgi:hypothetical protein